MRFRNHLYTVLCGTLLFVWSTQVSAQGGLSLSGSAGSPLDSVEVELESVLATAVDAFERNTASRMREELDVGVDEASEDRMRRLRSRLIDEFREGATEELHRLRADGLLTGGEVSEALDDLESALREDFETGITALQQGKPPPPLSRDFSDGQAYAAALIRYTFLERNGPRSWLLFAAATVGGLISAWLLNRSVRALGGRLKGNRHQGTSQLLDATRGPLYLLVLAISVYLGLRWLWIPGVAESSIELTRNIALVTAVAWFLWNATDAMGSMLAWTFRKTYDQEVDAHAAAIISRILRIAVLIGLLMFVIKVVLDTSLAGVAAGLGIAGVALALILRGTVENVGASFTIYADQPFRVGDLMSYDDRWAHVENIGFRSTRLRTLDGDLITVPNIELIDNAIHNIGARPHIRRRFHLSLPYRTSPEKVREAISILHDVLDGHRGQPEEEESRVYFETFGDYELRLLVVYYFEPPDIWEALKFDSEVNLEILERFNAADIEFAFPTAVSVLETAKDQVPSVRVQAVGTADNLVDKDRSAGDDTVALADAVDRTEQ